MFRRKEEDGSEALEATNQSGPQSSQGVTPNMLDNITDPAAPAANAPRPAVAPAAAAPAPAFRPAPPQAAMAAARTPSPAPAASTSSSAPVVPAVERPSPKAAAKRVLTVGPDIQMKGEITTCDRVVIEGAVDATLRDVHTVELAESGSLKGTAEVQDAEISGIFEGDIIVRGRLIIYSSGRVRGNVTYGEIEIERGGQISGNIRNAADAEAKQNGGRKAA